MLLPGDVDVAALSPGELARLVAELLGELAMLRDENAALRAEIARLKGLKGRPKLKPSGMERTSAGRAPRTQPPKRGKTTKRVVHEERVLAIAAPPGSRFKGYEDIVVQDLRLEARRIRYRRQRWLTPDGKTLVAPLPAGIQGRFGPELHRFVVLQHHQGQVTAERITAFLSSLGVTISKRQVVRLLTDKSAALVVEAQAVLRAGSRSTTPAPAIGPGTGSPPRSATTASPPSPPTSRRAAGTSSSSCAPATTTTSSTRTRSLTCARTTSQGR